MHQRKSIQERIMGAKPWAARKKVVKVNAVEQRDLYKAVVVPKTPTPVKLQATESKDSA